MDNRPSKGEYLEALLRSPRTIFSVRDAALLWKEGRDDIIAGRLNKYARAGRLIRIRRGFYAKDHDYDRLELASRVFIPSYVSFETVLTERGVNFQFYEKITAASYLTREICADGQTYSYRKINHFILINPMGIESRGGASVASPERALLDTLYIHTDYHFDHLGSMDWDKIFEILPIYENKRMIKKVNELFKSR